MAGVYIWNTIVARNVNHPAEMTMEGNPSGLQGFGLRAGIQHHR